MSKIEVAKKEAIASVGPGCHCACDWDLQFNAFFQAQVMGNACGCACQFMLAESLLSSAQFQP